MNTMTIFTNETLTPHLRLITEGLAGKRLVMGLVTGSRAALLIDSGVGLGGGALYEYVRGLVGDEKPLYCACTHGHPTALGAAGRFERAYLNRRDWPLAASFGLDSDARLGIMLDLAGEIPQLRDFARESFRANTDTVFIDYGDGFTFDLGDISVRALSLPGHTPGSMLLWCPDEDWLFSGGAIAQHLSLKTLDRDGLRRYITDARRVCRLLSGSTVIHPDSAVPAVGVGELRDLIDACGEILAGKTLNDIPGESNYSRNKNRMEMRAHFVENCSVAYDTLKVGAERSDIENFIFYSHRQVSGHVYVLSENNARDSGLTLGLVVGDSGAMLIDTGMGMNGQLERYVRSITGSLPLTVTSTHGNIDHIGGSIMFPSPLLNERDHSEVGRATGSERRFTDMDKFCMGNAEAQEYCRRHWVDNTASRFGNIDSGQRFDLGGVTVEVLYSAGHTPGHLSYFVPEEHVCFVGDSLSYGVLIRRLTRRELLLYAENMEKLYAHIGPDTLLYPGHSSLPHSPEIIHSIAAACREVAAGDTENDPPANILRPDKPGGLRSAHFHGSCRIIYEKGILDNFGTTVEPYR